jgi:hypothetical protein
MRWLKDGPQSFTIIRHTPREFFIPPVTISLDVHVLCLIFLILLFT